MMTKQHEKGGWYCPNCNRQTFKLVGISENGDYGCPGCIHCPKTVNTALLHRYENKYSRTLSVAKERVIDNRVRHPENRNLFIDKRTGRPTER